MSTIEIDRTQSEPKARMVRLSAALVAAALAVGGALVVGYQLAPSARVPARVTPTAGAEPLPEGTRVVTAGGWTGVVVEDTGIPVAAGIPPARGLVVPGRPELGSWEGTGR